MDKKLLALYGGRVDPTTCDQETREEYEARRSKKRRSKASEDPPLPSKAPTLQLVDAAHLVESVTKEPLVSEELNHRVDSSDSEEEGDGAPPRRRARVESSDDEEEECDAAKPSAADVDSDGDVAVSRARSSGSTSSSDSEDEQPKDTNGLLQRDEFRVRQQQQGADKSSEFDLGKGQKTVYRDTKTGNVVSEHTQEKSGLSPEAEEAILKYELNMGAYDKLQVLGKHVDLESGPDEKLESEDPMAAFLNTKPKTAKSKTTVTGKPQYTGPSPHPNRFQIPPGHRWDGVDRSNGFELRLMRTRNLKIDRH